VLKGALDGFVQLLGHLVTTFTAGSADPINDIDAAPANNAVWIEDADEIENVWVRKPQRLCLSGFF